MKTSKIFILVSFMMMAAPASASDGGMERLTEDAVKQFLAQRDELAIQGKNEEMAKQFTEDAVIIHYTSSTKRKPSQITGKIMLQSSKVTGKYVSCLAAETIPEEIRISDDGKQANVKMKQRGRIKYTEGERCMRGESDVTMILQLQDSEPVITWMETVPLNWTLEPSPVAEKIMTLIRDEGTIDQAAAVELLSELGVFYFDKEGCKGIGDVLSRETTYVGNELPALAAQIPGVEILQLGYSWVTDDGLDYIQGMDSLKMLLLPHTQITDEGLARLKSLEGLEFLSLEGTEVTDTGLVHLEELHKLEKLELEGSGVTQAGVKRLQEKLPELQIRHESTIDSLKARRNQIHGTGKTPPKSNGETE